MGHAAPVIVASILNPALALGAATAGAPAIGPAVVANQQIQHAKGAAEAEGAAINAQLNQAQKDSQTATSSAAGASKSSQAAAIAALKASLSTQGNLGGTILTGPQGAAPAPVSQKQLLGA